jgi:geranylgeranyl reductase family protein
MRDTSQIPTPDLPERIWDVIIAGAGPAGSICARTLARAGRSVLLLDKERFPRHKACGDMLIPDAVTLLRRLDLLDAILPDAAVIRNIRVYSPSRIDFDVPGEFLALRRFDLDHRLAQAARGAGATLARGYVSDIAADSDGVTVTADGRTLRGQVVVIATGAAVELAQRAGIVADSTASAVAIRCYVKSDFELSDVILSYDRPLLPGYAWVIPVGPHLYNVGCGARVVDANGHPPGLKRHLREFLDDFPLARELMARGETVTKISGAALRCSLSGNRALCSGRILAVGETVGTTFPFTGEGIGKAMHSALIAAEVINGALDNSPPVLDEYPRRIADEIAPFYYGYNVAERWLGRAWLNDFLSRRVTRSPYLRRQIRDFISETGDPRRLFSLGSVLKSFWK